MEFYILAMIERSIYYKLPSEPGMVRARWRVVEKGALELFTLRWT